MFHTAPRGHRTAPRTRVHLDKENPVPSKTPSRTGTGKAQVLGVGPSTVGLNRLAPGTVLRDTRNLMGTVNGKADKGKGKEAGEGKGDRIEPTRLFKTHINSSKSNSGLSQTLIAPRQTPAPARTLPAQTPLPSASRTSRRSRQSFATPIRLDGWDDELASGDVSIEVANADQVLEGLEEESDGEPEYMPPTAIESRPEPILDQADLEAIGKAASQRPKRAPASAVQFDFDFDNMPDFGIPLSDDIEDPIFAALDAKSKPQPPSQTRKPLATKNALPSSVRRPIGTNTTAQVKTTTVPARRPAVPSTTLARKPAVPAQTRQPAVSVLARKPAVPTANVKRPATSASAKAPPATTARKPAVPLRRPVVKPKPTDSLADLGINVDEALAGLGGDDFEFTL